MKTVAIIQARTGSTRLPGKVFLQLAGEPMLTRVIQRVQQAQSVSAVVVATTTMPGDQAIVDLCKHLAVPVYRGSEDDVLDRYYRTACLHEADTVIRITSDCPLIDPTVIDDAVEAFISGDPAPDYVTTHQFPRGLDTEVFSMSALERAWNEDRNPKWREHVTAYLYRHPELFNVVTLSCPDDHSSLRWTVDTPQDFELARCIYDHFRNDRFGWLEVLSHLQLHPALMQLNRDVVQKPEPGS